MSTSVLIDAPREQIYEYLQDIANHPEFTDHFLVDWRLTRERSAGTGAGARFRIKAPGSRFAWGEATFAECRPPQRIVEVGRMGKANRIRTLGIYELAPAAGGTTSVRFTFQTKPALPSDRIMESLGGRWWVGRANARSLRRLRALMEERHRAIEAGGAGALHSSVDALPGGRKAATRRITVAGG